MALMLSDPEAESQASSPEQDAVRKCADWFDKDREAKQPIFDTMEQDDLQYRGDHWDMDGPDGNPLRDSDDKIGRPNVVENMSMSLVEGQVAEFARPADLIDYPTETGDEEAAKVYTDLKQYLAYKNRMTEERIKWFRHLFKYGTAIWELQWDESWKGGRGPNRWRGDIRWRALHPQSFYPDARARERLEDAQRIHKTTYMALEEIERRWPETGKQVTSHQVTSEDLIGINTDDDDTQSEYSLEDQALVVETWYRGRPMIRDKDEPDEDGIHVVWWANPGQQVHLGHANFVHHDPGEEAKFPFILRACYPRENSLWGYSELWFLRSPQWSLNKHTEMILETNALQAGGQTFYEETALDEKQERFVEQYHPVPQAWFKVKRLEGIKRELGRGAPGGLQNEAQRLQRTMETIMGRFDISQGRTPANVAAFRALNLLAQRAQVRLQTKEETAQSAYEEAGNFINHLINRNYTQIRAYRIIGTREEAQKLHSANQLFRLADYQKVYLVDTGDQFPLRDPETGAEWQPPEGMAPDKYEVFSPEFDTLCKVSAQMPSDRMFYLELAKDLFTAQLIDAEIFFRVMDEGRFPPWEEIVQKIQAARAQAQQMAAMQAAQTAVPGMPGQTASTPAPGQDPVAAAFAALPPEIRQQFQSLSPEEQKAVLQRAMEESGATQVA